MMCLKAYHMSEHCKLVPDTPRQDFTSLETYHSGNYFIFQHDDREVNSQIAVRVIEEECPFVVDTPSCLLTLHISKHSAIFKICVFVPPFIFLSDWTLEFGTP